MRNVFISFDVDDEGMVNLLRHQAKNDRFPFEFRDYSVKRSDPLLFFKPAHPTFQARFRQAACSASHNSL